MFSFQLGELLRFLLLSGKKQKGGKRSFAESFIGITAVTEVSEQVVKYLERHRLCRDLLLTHLTHVAFLVLHQFPMKIRTRGFVLAKARARAWPSVVLFLPFHPWEDPKMVFSLGSSLNSVRLITLFAIFPATTLAPDDLLPPSLAERSSPPRGFVSIDL